MGALPLTGVYITGHSLGGAFATCLCSAAVLGNGAAFGSAAGFSIVERHRWDQPQLVTFAAPPVGNGNFEAAFALKGQAAKAYRFLMDAVPNLGKGKLVGRDIQFPVKHLDLANHKLDAVPYSHNPKPIRLGIKDLHNIQNDNEEPWTEGLKITDVLQQLRTFVAANPGQVSDLPYRFRDGLVVYLITFANMRSPNQPWDFVMQQTQKTAILNFIDRVCPPINPPQGTQVNPPFNWSAHISDNLPTDLRNLFNTIANIRELAEQPGLVKMLRHWLALIMVQASGQINASASRWFELQ